MDNLFEIIAELIAAHVDCDKDTITPETKFADLGIDSLDTVEIVMQLEEKIDKEVELEQKVETVQELVDYISSKYND
jgi:acyl carrier protein